MGVYLAPVMSRDAWMRRLVGVLTAAVLLRLMREENQ